MLIDSGKVVIGTTRKNKKDKWPFSHRPSHASRFQLTEAEYRTFGWLARAAPRFFRAAQAPTDAGARDRAGSTPYLRGATARSLSRILAKHLRSISRARSAS